MGLKGLYIILLASFLNNAHGEDCVHTALETIEVFNNATLIWTEDPNAECKATHYEVDIEGDREDVYHFTVTDLFVDVSFLEICEEWRFTITPYNGDAIGFGKTLTSYIPLPASANLGLKYFNATRLDNGDMLLEWELLDHTYGDCTLHYRLSVGDGYLGIEQDLYVEGTSLQVTFFSPCVQYDLGLRAVNRARPTMEGPILEVMFQVPPRVQPAPTLASVDIQATSIDMVWNIEVETNRCPLKAIHLEGNNFNITVDLMNWDTENPVEVSLKSLKPNSMYYFRVTLENNAGLSPAFPIAIQTLELDPN